MTNRAKSILSMTICLTFCAAALPGCGGSSEIVAKVNGQVTANGKPVTGGTLIFAPAGADKNPGPPAVVPVKDDGTFESRKVVVGKNTVLYNAPPTSFPEGYEPKPSEGPPPSPFQGLFPASKEIDVKGDAVVEIKLIRKK